MMPGDEVVTAHLATDADAHGPDAALQRSRRLDWRFALADPNPGRVGYAGPPDPELIAAMRDAGWRVTDIEPGEGVGSARSADLDLVVVAEPDGGRLAAASRSLRKGGSIHVTCDGLASGRPRHGRRLDAVEVRRRLERLGFSDLRTFVDVPRRSGRSAIVPLAEPDALRSLLRRHGGPVAAQPVVLLAEGLRRSGWLARLAPSVSVVGRMGPTTGQPADAVTAYLAGLCGDTALPAPILLTPSFRASRHVVALVPGDLSDSPRLVAKLARRPDGDAVARREAAMLHELGTMGSPLADIAPRLIADDRRWGLSVLVETGVEGRPLDPGTVSRDPAAAVDRVIDGLVALASPVATVARAQAPAPAATRIDRLALGPLDGFAAALPATPDEEHLIEITRQIIRSMRGADLPEVIEHGDVSHPNLFVGADDRLIAVDWELGVRHGLPAHDLVGFLGYVAEASVRRGRGDRRAEALVAAIGEHGGWHDMAMETYAARIDLDPTLLPALTVMSWARRVVGIAERLHDGRPATLASTTVDFLRGHRWIHAWRAAVERATDGQVR